MTGNPSATTNCEASQKPRGSGAAPTDSEAQAKRNAKRAAKVAEKAQHEPAKLSGDENFLCEAIADRRLGKLPARVRNN